MLIDEGAVTIRDSLSLELLLTWLYFRNGNHLYSLSPGCPNKIFSAEHSEVASVQTENSICA